MELFLALTALAVIACVVFFAVALVGFVLKTILWVVFFPIRLLFKLIGWLLGAGFAAVLLPIGFIVVAIVVIGGILMALLSLLAPLLPVAIVALVGWAIYALSKGSGSPSLPSVR